MTFTMSLLSVRAGGGGTATATSRAGGQAIAPLPVPLARIPARPASRTAAVATLAASAGCHVGPRGACGPASRQTSKHRQRAVAAASGAENGASSNGKPAVENVVVVGSGPAGYTAAIYAARANLKPVVFEGLKNGRGGQLMGTTEVENFPGFPEGITGPQLMERMAQQAERWGAELYPEDVEAVNLDQRPFWVRTAEREVRAHTIIMATGATALRLRLPHEDAFWSKGISACAICDGASPLFKNKPVAVVGGGDSACEEAVYLTKYASHVHLLVRKNTLRASKAMADRTMENERITVHFETSVDDAYGSDVLEGLKIKTKDGIKDLPVAGLFYGIGHQPNSSLFDKWVETDEKGYVVIKHGVDTSVDGVFSAGDLHDPEWRQAITAAGSGCMAALSAERYLTERGIGTEFKSSQSEEPSASRATSEAARKASSDSQVNAGTSSDEDSFDPTQDKHKGQFALRKLYHSSDRPIVVLYTSPSCGPCRSLKPIMNKVVDEFPGRVHYVLIDIEKDPEIAEAAGVNGTPTLQLFKNKERLVNTPGVKSKSDYRKMIQEALDSALVAA